MPKVKLSELIDSKNVHHVKGTLDIEISCLSQDSRNIGDPSSTLFFAVVGAKYDGHDFIENLINQGVRAFVVSKDITVPKGVTVIKVSDVRTVASDISCVFYGDPTKSINVVGVTGTKGKTTTTSMIAYILECANRPTGMIGTIYNKLPNGVMEAHNTTPDAIELQPLFHEMKEGGFNDVVMEVSSHAIALERIAHVDFDVAVMTNITSDHMDFHKTLENYVNTKADFFFNLGRYGEKEGKLWPKVAILNADDLNYDAVRRRTEEGICTIYTYACDNTADFVASDIVHSNYGIEFTLNAPFLGMSMMVCTKLVGKFNVYNALAAIVTCYSLGIEVEDICSYLGKFQGVTGRFQKIETDKGFVVIVDYAHTEDSLKNVLNTAKEFTKGRLITVFGCGGDRDNTKRPKMGAVASNISDYVIVTSDNPRSEDPIKIIEEIEAGIIDEDNYCVVPDRREAIIRAISSAKQGDTVMIAGKGHETYQIFKEETIHFDDAEEAMLAIKNLG